MRKEHGDTAARLGATIERDANVVRKRFAATSRRYDLDLRTAVVPAATVTSSPQLPPRVHEGFRQLHERDFYSNLPLDIDDAPGRSTFAGRARSAPQSAIVGFFATECVLEHNLRVCGAMGTPQLMTTWGEAGPPDDVDQKWRIDDLDIDESRTSSRFLLTTDLPLGEPPGPVYRAAGTTCRFHFIFPVGSEGRYCFYPLTACLGNTTFETTTGLPGYVSVHSHFTVSQGGNVLGWSPSGSWRSWELQPGDVMTVNLDSHDFGHDVMTVDLDSDPLVADVDVTVSMFCHLGDNDDGTFVFDFRTQGGEIRCGGVKWGKDRPVVVRDPLP